MKRPTFHISDKVVLMEAVVSVECFRPVPEVHRVYCVRDADGDSLLLVGIQGTYEEGEECRLVADKFRLLSEVQAKNAKRKGAK